MDLKQRLQYIITKNNLSASSFADKLSIQRSNISHILSGRNKPSLDFIEKFINHFPNEDVIWLITGINKEKNYNEFVNQEIKTPIDFKGAQTKTKILDTTPEFSYLESKRKIMKIITFYEDKTFDIYYPNSL